MNNFYHIRENIPVKLDLSLRFKEAVHQFFRRPLVIRILTYFPRCLLGKSKDLALLIDKCYRTFNENAGPIQVKVYGGDRLNTLLKFENELKKKQNLQKFATVFKFSVDNSLDAARNMRNEAGQERIGILNLANRWQPGGIGLAPYRGSQEEFLIRRSNLAWGLDPRFKTEKAHAELSKIRSEEGYSKNESFVHHIPYFGAVLSKDVTFIDQSIYDRFDVISAAAPDMRKGSDELEFIKANAGLNTKAAQHQILENKIKAIFHAAIDAKIENLVLGAFGCGAFCNDPQEVAGIFAKLLKHDFYSDKFHRVTFAITEQSKLKIFEQAFHS